MAKKPKKASKHADKVVNLWTRKAKPIEFGREAFRVTLHREKRKLRPVNIDDLVEGFNWERQGGQRTGEMNLHRPLRADEAQIMAHGDEVRCDVAQWGSKHYKPVWRMKVDTPEEQLQEGLITIALKSQIDGVTKSKASFKFRDDHHHPHGWNANEVTRAVARRFRIPLGELPKATYRFKKLVEHSISPLDVVTKAWRQERLHAGRRFDVDTSRGLLDVRELREPLYMLLIGSALLEDGTVRMSIQGLYSAVIVTTTVKKKGSRKKHKLRVKVVDEKRVKRYGYIVKTIKAPKGHDTEQSLRRYGKSWLARGAKPKNEIDVTMPGIPWVDRGDAVRMFIPEANVHQIVFVKTVRHQVAAGSYDMEITVGFADPWAADVRRAKTTRKKEAAAAKRKRRKAEKKKRQRGDHSKPKPKRYRVRSGA